MGRSIIFLLLATLHFAQDEQKTHGRLVHPVNLGLIGVTVVKDLAKIDRDVTRVETD